ncbi:MAG: hypothetical protein ACOYNN_14295 [Terrimicrobiaceae bacterium]
MRASLPLVLSVAVVSLFSGCLTQPVARSGGPGSITVPNSNPIAIQRAANSAFSQYGFSPSRRNPPGSLAFDRPAGTMGSLAFGGMMRTTSFRVRVQLIQLPGTNDFRLIPEVDRVNNANVAGFEDSVRMMNVWSGQFKPIMRQIKEQASNAGPGR